MFVIPPYEAGITLHTLGRPAQVFSSRRLVFRHLGWRVLRRHVGAHLDAAGGIYYVIRDTQGTLLLAPDFAEFIAPLRKTSHTPNSLLAGYLLRLTLREKALPGPVPGTGRHRGGNAYRNPRTRAERRDNIFVDHEAGEPPTRGARSWKTLASSWDDLVRSDYGVRSWKHFRSTQWKK